MNDYTIHKDLAEARVIIRCLLTTPIVYSIRGTLTVLDYAKPHCGNCGADYNDEGGIQHRVSCIVSRAITFLEGQNDDEISD